MPTTKAKIDQGLWFLDDIIDHHESRMDPLFVRDDDGKTTSNVILEVERASANQQSDVFALRHVKRDIYLEVSRICMRALVERGYRKSEVYNDGQSLNVTTHDGSLGFRCDLVPAGKKYAGKWKVKLTIGPAEALDQSMWV